MTLAPRLCIYLQNFAAESRYDWSRLLATAKAADEGGIDKLVVSDHVVFGEELDGYGLPALGGVRGGTQPTGPDGSWLEPLTLLSVVAGATSRVRLGTHVLLAALRRPVVLAKSLSTLDVLSGGRLDIGVGIGWQRAEYDAAGLDFGQRGRLLDETLDICRTLWRDDRASFNPTAGTIDGNAVEGIHQMPKPLQPGGVPLWISGTANARVISRLARFGSGWIPWGDSAADLDTSIPVVRRGVTEAGGDPDALRIVGNLPTVLAANGSADPVASVASAGRRMETGVTDFVARIPAPSGSVSAEEFNRWVQAFDRATGR